MVSLSFQNLCWTLLFFLQHVLMEIAALPRRATRGPLDAPDDPLAPGVTREPSSSTLSSTNPPPPYDTKLGVLGASLRDFSFLLKPEMYHPISQLDIPAPFRKHFPPAPDASLDRLLTTGHYLPAAALAANLLISPTLSPTDSSQIFSLLFTRLACLTITGNHVLAAEESKYLEDLNSNFYYSESFEGKSDEEPEHLVPWELRVLAIRLQSIGFNDGRRGLKELHDLNTEARANFSKAQTATAKSLWASRSTDIGIRIVNALIEMGSLEAAKNELQDQLRDKPEELALRSRLVLLLLRIGHVNKARDVLGPKSEDGTEGVLLPLLSMAEGNYDLAVKQWQDLDLKNTNIEEEALIRQNLAVCLLYTGQMKEARYLLENLVDSPGIPTFHSLTFNLATLYELCTEKSQRMKIKMVERVARKRADPDEECEDGWEKVNADFKL